MSHSPSFVSKFTNIVVLTSLHFFHSYACAPTENTTAPIPDVDQMYVISQYILRICSIKGESTKIIIRKKELVYLAYPWVLFKRPKIHLDMGDPSGSPLVFSLTAQLLDRRIMLELPCYLPSRNHFSSPTFRGTGAKHLYNNRRTELHHYY